MSNKLFGLFCGMLAPLVLAACEAHLESCALASARMSGLASRLKLAIFAEVLKTPCVFVLCVACLPSFVVKNLDIKAYYKALHLVFVKGLM